MRPDDCLFYLANPGGLVVDDLDGDGNLELVEVVDEYPKDGELSEEEETAIKQTFTEEGVDAFTEGARRIAIREKGGRGKPVAWAIFSYNGASVFVPQEGDNFEKYFLLLKSKQPDLVRKTEISEESIDYNEFVRTFWN